MTSITRTIERSIRLDVTTDAVTTADIVEIGSDNKATGSITSVSASATGSVGPNNSTKTYRITYTVNKPTLAEVVDSIVPDSLPASAIDSGTLLHERGGLEADVSSYSGIPWISEGTTTELKMNFAATVAPTTTDDSAAGYAVGSRWLDTTADKAYVCLDDTATAAVWTEITLDTGITDLVSDTTPQLGGQLDVNGNSIGDGTDELLKFSETGSAVNELTITNAATAGSPSLTATGDDANIDLTLDGKGTGTVKTTSSNLDITGNIVVSGTVDGRDVATDGTKLDGIESAATADQTGAEIKTAYEAEADTNAFTDAEKTKLSGIEASADVTDEANVTAALPVVDETNLVYKTGDATANMKIDANAITTATTRTLTMPDADIDLTADGSGSFASAAEGDLAATALQDLVDDTTPQLGGQLDVNGQALGDGTNELLTFTEDASAVNHINIENEATGSGPIISAAGDDANIDININGKGTGNITLGSYTLDGDQSVGAGQDNYVLKYDNASGLVSLEAEAAGGIGNVVEDTTPQLGGQLDVNGNAIGDGTRELLTFVEDASAVNHVEIENQATGGGPIIRSTGDDANVDLVLAAKGTGNIDVGNFTFDADATVGAGQDNYVLTYDNGTGTWGPEAAGAGGAWTLISTSTASASSEIDFTDLSSTYYMYAVVIEDYVPSLDASLYFRMSTDNGSTFLSTNYEASGRGYSSQPASSDFGNTSSSIIRVSSTSIGTDTGEGYAGVWYIHNPSQTTLHHRMHGHATYTNATAYNVNDHISGHNTTTSAVDAIRFYPSTGTMESGTFKLYGLAAS